MVFSLNVKDAKIRQNNLYEAQAKIISLLDVLKLFINSFSDVLLYCTIKNKLNILQILDYGSKLWSPIYEYDITNRKYSDSFG